MKDYKELGQAIRELRKEAGITSAELGRRTGNDRQVISQIEKGGRIASGEKLRLILNELGYDFEIVIKKI